MRHYRVIISQSCLYVFILTTVVPLVQNVTYPVTHICSMDYTSQASCFDQAVEFTMSFNPFISAWTLGSGKEVKELTREESTCH